MESFVFLKLLLGLFNPRVWGCQKVSSEILGAPAPAGCAKGDGRATFAIGVGFYMGI